MLRDMNIVLVKRLKVKDRRTTTHPISLALTFKSPSIIAGSGS
jgi:hypothetical protein